MIIPTRFMPFALSPLISPLGKLRMGLDLFIPRRQNDEDETLAAFIRRRLGDEAFDKIAEPLMSGIYNAESERQSLLATFPRFREVEKKHGSLIRGMLAARHSSAANHNSSSSQQKPVTPFLSFRRGTHELIYALARQLTGEVRLNTTVTALTRQQDRFHLTLDDGATITAHAVLLAIPAYAAAKLVRPFAPVAADQLQTIRYVSTGTISFAFKVEDIPLSLDGTGIVIPRSEGRAINAITWSSSKFDHRAPAGYALIRVFVGGSRNPQMLEKPDAEIVQIARAELAAIMQIRAEPLFHRIYRWPRANPQYDVGHLDRVAAR